MPDESAPAASDERPPYAIPSMGEIRAAAGTNGLTVVSTFTGAGGSCLGFEWAGYRVLWASEFVAEARAVHEMNFPDCPVDSSDIRSVDPSDILAAVGMGVGEIDVVQGSPPCASFSLAGKRDKHWGEEKKYSSTVQRTDDLFWEFARIVDGIRPRAFVAENVPGLRAGKAKGYLKEIYGRLVECGYRVAIRELDAQWLGVPQVRKRLIFVGLRDDVAPDVDIPFPRPLGYRYSLRDACPWIGRFRSEGHGYFEGYDFDAADRPAPTVTTARGAGYHRHEIETSVGTSKGERSIDLPVPTVMTHNRPKTQSELTVVRGMGAPFKSKGQRLDPESPFPAVCAQDPRFFVESDDPRVETGAPLDGYAIDKASRKLKPGEQSDKYFNLVRAHPDRPCPTVTQTAGNPGAAGVIHPTERRKFSIAELRRICGFPDDFRLVGSYSQQWERLGRAVPPPMMMAVARALAGVLAGSPRP